MAGMGRGGGEKGPSPVTTTVPLKTWPQYIALYSVAAVLAEFPDEPDAIAEPNIVRYCSLAV